MQIKCRSTRLICGLHHETSFQAETFSEPGNMRRVIKS